MIYVFDLDGTLADINHRLKYIQGEKKDWRSFFAACPQDEQIEHTARVFRSLKKVYEVWILTGRSEEVRKETLEWLMDHDLKPDMLFMRKEGDHRHDHVIKKEWLYGLDVEDRHNIQAVFEDRDQVVKMWRENDIVCYQVAPGDF